ncbi:Dihydroorotate dehydrogenase [compost metagenome]
MAQLLTHPDVWLRVAVDDEGRLLGFIGLHFMAQLALPGDFCRITYFCVGDAARSAGVGRELEAAAEAAGGRLPLIAVGGISDGADAWARIRAGASAVQVYSAMIYEGPGMVGRIKRDLAARLRAEGFSSVAEAVGSGR